MVVEMKGCAVLLICCLFFVISAFGSEHVPVLMWESSKGTKKEVIPPSSLTKLSSDDFSDFLLKKVASHSSKEKPLIAVFVEENLSVEDFSWQDVEEHISFPSLENLTRMSSRVDFLPAVHAPLKGLKSLGYHWQTYHSNNDTEGTLPDEGGVVLLVKLGDAKVDEDRPDFLRRHDHTIGSIYSSLLSKYVNIIALYTAHHSSWTATDSEPSVRRVRSLLAVEDSETNATFWHDKDNTIYLYTPIVPTINLESDDPSKAINLTGGTITADIRNQLQRLVFTVSINSKRYTLRFRFPMSDSNYWKLLEVEFAQDNGTKILKTSTDIYAPVGFSYHCGSQITFVNGSITLNLTNVQIQPYLKEAKFGDAYDCVWFFTAPIWSGLFVTAMLALIMIWGLSMILDIKTMDQFDDPKGKAITINASE